MNPKKVAEKLAEFLETYNNTDVGELTSVFAKLKSTEKDPIIKELIGFFIKMSEADYHWSLSYDTEKAVRLMEEAIDLIKEWGDRYPGIPRFIVNGLSLWPELYIEASEIEDLMLGGFYNEISEKRPSLERLTEKGALGGGTTVEKMDPVWKKPVSLLERYLTASSLYLRSFFLFTDAVRLIEGDDKNTHKLRDILNEFRNILGCGDILDDEYSEILQFYTVLKRIMGNIPEKDFPVVIKNAEFIFVKSFYVPVGICNLYRTQEDITRCLSETGWSLGVNIYRIPEVLDNPVTREKFGGFTVYLENADIYYADRIYSLDLSIYLSASGIGAFIGRTSVENITSDRFYGMYSIPSEFSAVKKIRWNEKNADKKEFGSYIELCNYLAEKLGAVLFKGRKILTDNARGWFTHAIIHELGESKEITDIAAGIIRKGDHDKTHRIADKWKWIVLEPRESLNIPYSWLCAVASAPENVAVGKLFDDNFVFIGERHCLYYTEGSPYYVLRELIDSVFLSTMMMFMLNYRIEETSGRRNRLIRDIDTIKGLVSEHSEDPEKLRISMRNLLIELHSIMGEVLNLGDATVNLRESRYPDHKPVMDAIFRELGIHEKYGLLKDSVAELSALTGSLEKILGDIKDAYDKKLEEKRNRFIKYLNILISVLSVTSLIDYLAPVVGFGDAVKFYLLVGIISIILGVSFLIGFRDKKKHNGHGITDRK